MPPDGVITCISSSVNGKSDNCIRNSLCEYDQPKAKFCSHFVTFNINKMSAVNSPGKPESVKIIVNLGTQSGKVNYNVVLNNLANKTLIPCADSDIKLVPLVKIKRSETRKQKIILWFAHQFPLLSDPFLKTGKRVYSLIATDCCVVLLISNPQLFNLKRLDAYLEKDRTLKTIEVFIRGKDPKANETLTCLGQ